MLDFYNPDGYRSSMFLYRAPTCELDVGLCFPAEKIFFAQESKTPGTFLTDIVRHPGS